MVQTTAPRSIDWHECGGLPCGALCLSEGSRSTLRRHTNTYSQKRTRLALSVVQQGLYCRYSWKIDSVAANTMSRYNSTAQESNLSKDNTSYIEDPGEQEVLGTVQSRNVAIGERLSAT